MAKRRQRKERRRREPVATSEYRDAEGNSLVLRDALSAATIEKVSGSLGSAAGSLEDVWRRRTELLFERLAVSWEIAGLPIDDQKMLLGRYRMADAETREWVRRTIAGHLEEHIPQLAAAL